MQVEYEVRDGYYVVAADGTTRFDGGDPQHFSYRGLRTNKSRSTLVLCRAAASCLLT